MTLQPPCWTCWTVFCSKPFVLHLVLGILVMVPWSGWRSLRRSCLTLCIKWMNWILYSAAEMSRPPQERMSMFGLTSNLSPWWRWMQMTNYLMTSFSFETAIGHWFWGGILHTLPCTVPSNFKLCPQVWWKVEEGCISNWRLLDLQRPSTRCKEQVWQLKGQVGTDSKHY